MITWTGLEQIWKKHLDNEPLPENWKAEIENYIKLKKKAIKLGLADKDDLEFLEKAEAILEKLCLEYGNQD